MYSRGPIIRTLELFSLLASVASLIALVIALINFLGRVDDIQRARYDAYLDTCYAIRGIAHRAIPDVLHPDEILAQSGFGNCVEAAKRILEPTSPHHKQQR